MCKKFLLYTTTDILYLLMITFRCQSTKCDQDLGWVALGCGLLIMKEGKMPAAVL